MNATVGQWIGEVEGKSIGMVAQLVDLLDPVGLGLVALYIGVPVALVVALVFAIIADFRKPKDQAGGVYDGRAFPLRSENDAPADSD